VEVFLVPRKRSGVSLASPAKSCDEYYRDDASARRVETFVNATTPNRGDAPPYGHE
jgi:hypothetical protein